MSAADLLQHLRTTGFAVTAADGGGIRVAPAGTLSSDQRQAIRDYKPALLLLLADDQAQADQLDGQTAIDQARTGSTASPTLTLTQTCAGCKHLTRRQTCTEPAAAGLDAPPGHPPDAGWFGIRWPPPGHGTTCAAHRS